MSYPAVKFQMQSVELRPILPSSNSLLFFSLNAIDNVDSSFTMLYGKDGSFYSGDSTNELRHGKGILVVWYTCCFLFFSSNDLGACTYYDGATYEGEWKDGKKHGFGVMRFSTEGIYEVRVMLSSEC